MSIAGKWGRRIWYFLNRRRLERELEREMASHRAQLQDPRRFGSVLRIREQSADVWGWTWVDDLIHDIRYGARQLRRAPTFAAIAILTLALGIGANTAIFSVIAGDFLFYAPVRDPASLRSIEWIDAGFQSVTRSRNVPYEAFLALTETRSFASAACATDVRPLTIRFDTTTSRVPVQKVTGGYFKTLGIDMVRGRPLTAADDRRGAAPAAVISNSMWRQLLASAPDVVGRAITVDGAPVTIVGVTPAGFYARPLWRRVDVWVVMPPPVLSSTPSRQAGNDDGRCQPILRLRAGIGDEEARAEAALLLRPFVSEQPPASGGRVAPRFTVRVNGFGRGIDDIDMRTYLRDQAAGLAAASFLLATMLLIPCSNIAGIMLARAATRRREITTRLAIGAWRGRLVRQLLTEGLLLSSIAGVLGVVLFQTLFVVLRDSTGAGPVVADIRVLLYSAGLCLATAMGFSLAPALRATRIDLASTLRDGATGGFGRPRVTAAKILTTMQVLLASVLLIGTAVQGRTLVQLMAPRGVEPERVTLIGADLGTGNSAVTNVRGALDQLGNLPGVEVASAAGPTSLGVVLCDRDIPAVRGVVLLNIVAPGFLRSTRIPLTAGRDFHWDDENAAVINQSLARRLYGETDPIGRTFRFSECQQRLTIVGVVADSNNAIGPDFSGGNGTDPTAYVPLSSGVFNLPRRYVTFFVRTSAKPVAAEVMVRAMRETDTPARVLWAQTQAQVLANNRRGLRNAVTLLAGVSLLAVFQAAFGLYAVLAHFVSRRTAEIGIRAVLGASPIDLVRLVARQSLAPVGIGLGIAAALTPVAISVLAQARLTATLDAGEQIAVLVPALALLLAAFAAACGPALRAARISPSVAVRTE